MSDEQLQTSSQDVERIRDIIFGTQMRDYQQRFDALAQDVARLHQDLDRLAERLAEQDAGQEKKVEALRREMRQATDDLENELRGTSQKLGTEKVERMDLGQLLVQIGTHLTQGTSFEELFGNLAGREQDSRRDG